MKKKLKTKKLQVIAALQTENDDKDLQIRQLGEHMEELKRGFNKKQVELEEENEKKLSGKSFFFHTKSCYWVFIILNKNIEMTSLINEKEAAFKVLQQELAVIKDFRASCFFNFYKKKIIFYINFFLFRKNDMTS